MVTFLDGGDAINFKIVDVFALLFLAKVVHIYDRVVIGFSRVIL